ncbi:MAG: alpha/beta hydrolase [Muribaculaceae bacterium]
MKRILGLFVFFIACLAASAQICTSLVMDHTEKIASYELWPNGAPNSNGIDVPEIDNLLHVLNVTKPQLTVYVPKHPCGVAVLACPGGSYLQVWIGTEGHNMAYWYNSLGITYAVLKYRLPNGHHEVPLSDVHRAMQILKTNRTQLHVGALGIQGCSAGGHLASTAATHYASPEQRPDFQILFYPVITFGDRYTHADTRANLLGKNPGKDLMAYYSNELQVTADTPPAFIAASSDDRLVSAMNSVEYYRALLNNGVQATLLLYPNGGHGWFGNPQFRYQQSWQSALASWLETFSK